MTHLGKLVHDMEAEINRLRILNAAMLAALDAAKRYIRCPHTKRQDDCSRCVFTSEVERLTKTQEPTV
jgi:hypothetical protein